MEYSERQNMQNTEEIVNSRISFYSYSFKRILNHATKNKNVMKTNSINNPRRFEGNYITSANPIHTLQSRVQKYIPY